MKLNNGAGHDIYDGWINHDIAALPGIDVVHDLNLTPWPWNDESMDEVVAYDVIEHLDDFIKIMEELWRVMAVGGRAKIRVPYMGSWSFAADPTHRRAFHESTFMFFDPTSSLCQERSYYSHARFTVKTYSYICAPFIPFFVIPGIGEFHVRRRFGRAITGFLGMHLISNLIQGLEIELERMPSN